MASKDEGALRCELLGPLAVRRGEWHAELPGARVRSLLAALLLRPAGFVSAGQLISAVWGQADAVTFDNLYHHMSSLRTAMRPLGVDIPRVQYRLSIPDDSVDARQFSEWFATAAALRDTEPEEALRRLRQATGLWRGPNSFPELQLPGIRALGHQLDLRRLDAEEMLADLEIRLGQPETMIDHLRDLAVAHPNHPGLIGALISVLAATGRPDEADQVYRAAVHRYGEQVPAKIEQARQAQRAAAARTVPGGWHVPDQILAVGRHFTGRQAELRALTGVDTGQYGAPVVLTVTGTAGVGKTALALRAARDMVDAGRFPDGALYVDLRGFSGTDPLDPLNALDGILQSLGVPGDRIPSELDTRSALFRTVVARRRVLLVLDNAFDEAQVRPLLPGTATSLVLVTSRRRLTGLDDAESLQLDPMPLPEAVQLFRAVVMPRPAGDQDTVEEVVLLCGLLPLAVRIAGARLRTTRALTTEHLLALLRTEQGRLMVLNDGGRSVAAALAVSYQHLPPDQQHAFATLGLHPGAEFEPYSTAALLGTDPPRAYHLLDALEQVNLVDQHALGRYRFHDLIRHYAATTGMITEPAAPLGRLYDLYAAATSAAMDLAYPYESDRRPEARPAGTALPGLGEETAALGWLDAELGNLLAAAQDAAGRGRADHVWHQSATLHRHLRTRGRYTDARALHELALETARSAGETGAELGALIALGSVHRLRGRHDAATAVLTRALEQARRLGDPVAELDALAGLGQVHNAHGNHGAAVDCFGQALGLARATAQPGGELDAYAGIGYVHLVQDRPGPAADCYGRALELAAEQGHWPGELNARSGLAHVHLGQHRLAEAAAEFERVMRLARRTGNAAGEVNATLGLGDVHYFQGRYDSAAGLYARALEMALTAQDSAAEIRSLTGLGDVRRQQGQLGPAADSYRRAVDLARGTGARNYEVNALLGLGRTHQSAGDPDLAAAAHDSALRLARELDQRQDEIRALDGLAHARRATGHPDQARALWGSALPIFTELGIAATEDVSAADIAANLDDLSGR